MRNQWQTPLCASRSVFSANNHIQPTTIVHHFSDVTNPFLYVYLNNGCIFLASYTILFHPHTHTHTFPTRKTQKHPHKMQTTIKNEMNCIAKHEHTLISETTYLSYCLCALFIHIDSNICACVRAFGRLLFSSKFFSFSKF